MCSVRQKSGNRENLSFTKENTVSHYLAGFHFSNVTVSHNSGQNRRAEIQFLLVLFCSCVLNWFPDSYIIFFFVSLFLSFCFVTFFFYTQTSNKYLNFVIIVLHFLFNFIFLLLFDFILEISVFLIVWNFVWAIPT